VSKWAAEFEALEIASDECPDCDDETFCDAHAADLKVAIVAVAHQIVAEEASA